MLKIALFGSVAVLVCAAFDARAVSLPSDEVDRAIVCSVYGGFAPEADPRTAPAKRAIDRTVEDAPKDEPLVVASHDEARNLGQGREEDVSMSDNLLHYRILCVLPRPIHEGVMGAGRPGEHVQIACHRQG